MIPDTYDKYIYSAVGLKDKDYLVLLLSIYDNGFFTSAGFEPEIIIPDTPLSVQDTKQPVLFSAGAAAELPPDWPSRTVQLSDSKEQDYATLQLLDIDWELVEIFNSGKRPGVYENCPVYIGSDGIGYRWCRLLPEAS